MITPCAAAEAAVTAYEELRSQVVHGWRGAHFGMVVLLREGVAGWIERCSTDWGAAQASIQSVAKALLPDRFHTELVHLLADIALTAREEMKA